MPLIPKEIVDRIIAGENSPPDRDCSDRQIKTAKQPRREVVDRHPRFAKQTQFDGFLSRAVFIV